jgi:hypothetical protein
MAEFCLATGISPSEYRKLTLIEMMALVKARERQLGQ